MAPAVAAAVDRPLLLASFAAGPTDAPSGPAPAPGSPEAALALLQAGDYTGALASALQAAWAAAAPSGSSASPESTPDWFDAAGPAFQRLLEATDEPAAAAAEQVLLAAVAALHLFLQANLTGPSALTLPECPFDLLDGPAAAAWQQQNLAAATAAAASTPSGTASDADAEQQAGDAGFGRDSASPGDRWAAAQLSENGEDLVGRIRLPQYLLLGRALLLAPLEVRQVEGAPAGTPAVVTPPAWLPARLPSWPWWALRAVLLQQRLLSGLSAGLRSLLLGLAQLVLDGFAAPVEAALRQLGTDAGGSSGSGSSDSSSSASRPSLEDQLLAAGALLEAALLETAYGHVEPAKALLQRSGDVLGFRPELTGAMGVRTVHQQEAKAQLLVAVGRQPANPWTAAQAAGALPDQAEPQADIEAAANEKVELPAELKGFDADSDVLPHPRLLDEAAPLAARGLALPSNLHSLEQALLLGWCLHVRKGSAADGLQPWEMAAYVDALARQERTQFLLHSAAVLQAARLEKQRSRTRDRALLQFERLADAVQKPVPQLTPATRLRYAFSVWFPLAVQLRKELGELLVALGLVGAALQLFESLELWDNLIVCYQLLDKRVQAEQLIRRRLEVTPDEPRLWCALGDLTLDDACYTQAWERSAHRNARSQRSLARNALRNERYAKAAGHWEAALALNPLHPEGWFSLGYCYIKEKDYPKALQAFTRSSQLEPDNGEAWNNLAAIHMHLQHWRQAFNALSEAVKHKRDSWQTWENYAQVAARVGQWQTAVRALQQVLALSEGRRLDLSVLTALVGQVETARRGEAGSGAAAESEQQQQRQQQQAGVPASDAAPAAEGTAPAAPAAEPAAGEGSSEMADLASALGELSTGGAPGNPVCDPEAVQRAEERAQEVLQQSVGNLMKQVAATVSGDSAFWEVYARYQAAIGYPEAAKECLLKRVRALGGAGWQASADGFRTYAAASLALCKAYLQAAEGGGPTAQRDLSSARLHLRGLIKQAADRYEDETAYKQLQEMLAEVEERQRQAQS